MRHAKKALCLGLLAASGWSFASDSGEESLAIASTSTQGESQIIPGYLRDELFSFKPEFGLVAYANSTSAKTSQTAGGIGIEWNTTRAFGIDPHWYFGFSSGGIYSNLPDSRLLFIPIDLKEGYNFTDYYRISAHAGANMVYRSVAQSINLSGSGGDPYNTNSAWTLYPNVGMDLDVAIGKNLALFIRPDFTLAPASTIFLGTFGLGLNFG